jgi:hypothetical protein
VLRDQIDFSGSVMRVTGIKLGERVRPLRPVTDLRVLPSRVEQLTAEWLTGALYSGHTNIDA